MNGLMGRAPDLRGRINRSSYDVDDRRARVARRYGDGSKSGTGRWVRAYLRAAREFDVHTRRETGRSPIGASGVQVLEAILLNHWHDFRSGHIDPALSQLERATGYARTTIVAILKRLKQHGFIDWVRRTQNLHRPGEAGPQRCQVNNLYFIDLRRLPLAVSSRLQQLVRALLGKSEQPAPAPAPTTKAPSRWQLGQTGNPDLDQALASIEAALVRNERELHSRTVSGDQNKIG